MEAVMDKYMKFSIHSPLAGRDWKIGPYKRRRDRFQSTRPLRGETESARNAGMDWDFSIHSPLAGRDGSLEAMIRRMDFSIHSPLAGRDINVYISYPVAAVFSIHSPLAGRDHVGAHVVVVVPNFQSTRPLRGETLRNLDGKSTCCFSIHSPLAGRDSGKAGRREHHDRFSIHSPLAGRDL